MNVIDKVVVDVSRIRPNIVHAVQDDSTRIIRITLLNENEPLDITADLESGESVIGLVAFKTQKGAKGEYDTLDDDTTPAVVRGLDQSDPAYSYTWDAVIEGGVTCDSGKTLLTIKFFTESGKMLQTFPVTLFVHPSATPLNEPSHDYYNVVALADVQQMLTDFRDDIDEVEQSEQELAGIVQSLGNDYVEFKTEVNNKLTEIGAIEDVTDQFEAQSGTAEYFASSLSTVGAYYFKANAASIWYVSVYNSGTDRFNVATNYKDEAVIHYTWIDGALCAETVTDFANDNPKTKIFFLSDPTEDDQAASKGYVDSLVGAGLPEIHSGDDGKIISVVSGAYALVDNSIPASIQDATDTWLTEHITNPDSPPLDTSLSVSGAAADAKVAGSKITNLDSAVYREYTDTSLFESGGIGSSNGKNSASSTRIRTATYLSAGIKRIRAASGYKYIVVAYNDAGTYVGMWSGSAFAKSAKWLTGETQLSQIGSYQYRIVFANSSDGSISASDASNLTLCATTDASLSGKGVPADAQETGAQLAQARAEIQDVRLSSGKEIHMSDDWTYYGTGIFSGSSITPAAAYNIYYFVADANFNLWTDSEISDSEDVYLRIYTGLPFDSSTYVRGGTYLRNDQGVVSTDTMPKADSKFAIEAGQYVVVSVAGSSTWLRFLADGGSVAKNYLYPNVVLDDAQIAQVDAAQMRPLIKKTATRVDMYVPTSNKKYYLNYCFVYTNHGIEGEVTDNSDGWRMSYLYLRKPDLSSVAYIVYNGEWEMAIRLDGRSDYIGLGNHGDEIQSLFKLYVDGENIAESGTFDLREFHKAQLIQKLTMYDPLDHTTVVGYHTRIDTIDADRRTATIENRVEFVTSQTIRAAYLFMCPISRSHDSVQITDTFIDNRDYILTDCSSATFSPSDANHGVGETKQGISEYQFWGAGLGLHGYARVLRRVAPDEHVPNSHISNDASYNKIYFGMCSNGSTVSNGTTWLMETEFYLDSGYDGV